MNEAVAWIQFVRQYGPIPRNDNMYDETIQRSARRAQIDPIRFEHPQWSELRTRFQLSSPRFTSTILTGDAGDGKTSLCRQVWELLGGDPANISSGQHPYLTRLVLLPDGREATFHLITDLSAWVPQRLKGIALWDDEKSALLERLSALPFEDNAREYFLLAANDGQLVETWRRLPASPGVIRFRDHIETSLVENRQEVPEVNLLFLNLSRGSSAALFEQALDAFLAHTGWEHCYAQAGGEGEFFDPASPIRHNYELLRSPLVRERLRALYELCDYNALHVPIRHVLLFLANAVLGHPDCRDRLMTAADVSRITREGRAAEANIYGNFFGANLTRSRRESLPIFDYLDRFRIGHETSNRIDNLLIYGNVDTELRADFERLFGCDLRYGANPAFLEAQRNYVEGGDEDENQQAGFLSVLVSQRRGLFFRIPPQEQEELRLWELTVFKFAGEYLARVAGALKSGKRVGNQILSRLVRGLNRIFVGMLVTSDYELILATGLSFANTRVCRLIEERVQVRERIGEKVEIVLEDAIPVLKVHLGEGFICLLSLHLTRYEFLSRVAEGALPNSFSRECYEDILAFKSRLLAAVAARRKQRGEEGEDQIFRLLRLDDSGGASEEVVDLVHG